MRDIQTVKVDMNMPYCDIYINAAQYDTLRTIQFELYQNGEQIDAPDLPVKTYIFNGYDTVCYDCDVVDGVIKMGIDDEFTQYSGKFDYRLVAISGEEIELEICGFIYVYKSLVEFTGLSGSVEDAQKDAIFAESYNQGGTDTRTGEDTDNAAYYYGLVSDNAICICYRGEIGFGDLPVVFKDTNVMYTIVNAFTSDSTFTDGGDIRYPARTKVVYNGSTWDCLQGGGVVGVKGQEEVMYRNENVNITKDNIALPYGVNIAITDTMPDSCDYWLCPIEE